MIRKFTVRAINNCEMFTLTIEELEKMKMEFPEIFVEMFKNAFDILRQQFDLKIQMIKKESDKLQGKSGLAAILIGNNNNGNLLKNKTIRTEY